MVITGMNQSATVHQSVDGRNTLQNMEIAARNVDRSLNSDTCAPSLIEVLNINPQVGPSASGLVDTDYPSLTGLPLQLSHLTQIKTYNKVALPPEIKEHFSHVQCHCMMGLFPEIHRAWLTIDSDIYVWTYEENSDVAYYDGLNDTILCVGMITPKPGVFHSYIRYLLVLVTAAEVIVLGVTFTPGANATSDEIQLIADPVFTIPTDGAVISTVCGTSNGRLFLGSKEGCLYEIAYQAESSWFGKRCKKINHSTSSLSFLVPSFLNAALSEEDGIIQISVDNSRHILYTLTEKGSIEVFDLGEKGNYMSKITKLTQSSLVNKAMNTVKTLDSQNFRPIVSISAVELYESPHINLVAVTQSGIRFYLSTASLTNIQPNQRPYTLSLVHVRLPPGYSANVTVRPRMVHLSQYRDRNLLLVSTVDDKDVLWCLSSDLFPFNNSLMEAYTSVALDGPALAFTEVKHRFSYDPTEPLPPLVVRQHAEAPRKYVALTAHGAHILLKLRPVDILRQLLIDYRGPDSEVVKMYFIMQKEEQACATSLILASLEEAQNQDVAEWAARAFFMFGGEPRLIQDNDVTQINPLSNSTFMPNVISTPVAPHYQQNQMASPTANLTQLSPNPNMEATYLYQMAAKRSPVFEVNAPFAFSAKHNGLYLYLARILRPVWNKHCLQQMSVDGKKFFFTSTISGEECFWVLSHLNALQAFLQRNTHFAICNSSYKVGTSNKAALNQTQPIPGTSFNLGRPNFTIEDAQLEERQSLTALRQFLDHCCEVLGLWRILCEHQLHELVATFSENHLQMLQNTTFKDLLLFGSDLCSLLIAALINTYLGDNASVDSISSKLRSVCPTLFKSEDAAYSKANEILKTARSMENPDVKEEYIASALQLCKSVAQNINLHEICREFTFLKAYRAVTDLCLACAQKVDPDNLGERYYKTASQTQDQEGYQAYLRRMDIYKEVLNMLDTVYVQNQPQGTRSPNAQVASPTQKIGTADDANLLLHQIINDILLNRDELLHIAVYEWMLSKQMKGDLIKINEPSLETYLVNASKLKPDNIEIMDLLWRYYESNNNHSSAAKILNTLASKPTNSLTLRDRIMYLARSVMCMKSDKIGYAPQYGVFLRELEDKVEIAKVQEQILKAITNLRANHPNKEQAIAALNSNLFDITQLYETFAEPFELWECKLAIIECSGYNDAALSETIWRNILQEEVHRSSGSGNERMVQILTKVKYLARTYKNSHVCFPLTYIVSELEYLSAKLKADKSLVINTLVSVDISIEELIKIYSQQMNQTTYDRFWSNEDNQFHFAQVICVLINCFLENHKTFGSGEKRKIIALCQDTVAGILSELYSKPNTNDLISTLKDVQSKVNKL